MVKQEFKKLIAAIEAGALTPSQMEDVVFAMHAAYVDHFEPICNQLSTSLEDFADGMVLARKNTEGFDWEINPMLPFGYVQTVANVEGVALETAQ